MNQPVGNLKEVRPGELYVGERRVCILALHGVIGAMADSIVKGFGPEVASQFGYEIGYRMENIFRELVRGRSLQERLRSGLENGFRTCGFGVLKIESMDLDIPRLELAVDRGMHMVGDDLSPKVFPIPRCNAQRGMISAFVTGILGEEGIKRDIYTVETECGFYSSDTCRFSVAPASILSAEGHDTTRNDFRIRQLLEEATNRARESERLYKTLLDSVDSFIWLLKEDFTYQYINDRFFRHTGYSREEVMSRPATLLIHPESLGSVFEAAEKLRSGQSLKGLEYRIRYKDGSWHTHRATVVPLPGKGEDEPVMGLGVSQDVTEDKARQEDFRYLNALRQGIIDNANVLILSMDRNRMITVFNRALEEATGFGRREFLGEPIRKLVPSQDASLVEATINEHLRGLNMEEWDLKLRSKDGSILVCRMQPSPVVSEGEVIGVVQVGRDISDEVQKEYSESYRAEMEKEIEDLRRRLEGRYEFSNIVARAPSMKKVFEIIRAVAGSSATVLIQGETGTGKALVARAIHYNSPRHDKPFVEVDCGVLSETLLESELFGHVRGAFTGAVKDKIGRFELANGGTIFLDEIANLSFALQSKLLRAVQEGKFERVGGTDTISVDVRIVTATNEDLARLVDLDKFRKDLYYRLNVIKIELPPLRQRKEDIPLLAMHFVEWFAGKNGKDVKGFTPGAMQKLVSYHWPGNVRELENVVEQAVVFAREEWIEPQDLQVIEGSSNKYMPASSEGVVLPLEKVLEAPERAYISEVLHKVEGNKSSAAKLLQISRSTLYDKIRKYGLLRE